jgi:anti-anti-sigma factor
MSLTLHKDAQASLIRLEGTFTFESHGAFKTATQELLDLPGCRTLTLDLSGLSYMDSSSLGMLLLLRDKTEAKGIKVVLIKPSPTVMSILKVVQFGRLFEIQES